MDTISTAIVTALTAIASKVGEQVIIDGYALLKKLLKKKFGDESEVAKSIESLETKPESPSRQATLHEEIMAAKADQDPEILSVARELLQQIRANSEESQLVQKVTGDYNASVQGSGTATVNVNQPLK